MLACQACSISPMADSPPTTLTQAAARGFLSALTEAEREALGERGVRRSFAPGTTIFHEHDESDRVVLVLRGRLKVYSATPDGREAVFAFRSPGDLLGELSALDGQPRSASVAAVEPVEAVFVAAVDFRTFLQAHPRVALLLLEMLSWRLRDADRKRVEYAAFDSVGRVASRLVELAGEHGESKEGGRRDHAPALPGGARRMDGLLAGGREQGAPRAAGAGLGETDRRRITVLDIEALRRRSS